MSITRLGAVLCVALAAVALVTMAAPGALAAPAGPPADAGLHSAGSADGAALAPAGEPVLSPGAAPAALEHDYDDREHVDDRAEVYHFSAVGGIFTDTPYEDTGEQVGTTATGVLVSDKHVLTAAHVVTDDAGDAETQKDFWFAPGMTEIDGETTLHHGRAKVQAIHVDPDYDGGNDNADDVALLTLDRPIGEEAGHFDLAAIDGESAWGDQFYFLGYPGDNQLRQGDAYGDPQHSESWTPHRLLGTPFDQGDSGGPLFKNPGDPRVYSVVSGIRTLGDSEISHHAAPITDDRREWLEARMDEDGTFVPKPELYRADRVEWVDDGTQRAPSQITPSDGGEFATTLYNGGHRQAEATVEFHLADAGAVSIDDAPGREPVCSATVTVPGDDTATASCTGTTPAGVEEDTYAVFPVFEAQSTEHLTTNDREYFRWKSTEVDTTVESGTSLVDVDGPGSVPVGEDVEITATVTNGGSSEELIVVEFGSEERDEVPYEARTVTVPAGGQADATVTWPTNAGATGETFSVPVSADGDSQTIEFTVVPDPPDVEFFTPNLEDGQVGEPYSFDFFWHNTGGDGRASLEAYAYGPDGEELLTAIGNEDLGELTSSSSGTVEFEFTPDESFADGATIQVEAYNGEDFEPGDEVSTAVEFEPAAPETTIAIETLRDPVMPTAEVVDVGAVVENPGTEETSTSVSVSVDGENLADAGTTVTIPANGSERVDLAAPIDPEAGGELDVAVETASGASDARTVDVAEPVDITLRDQYEPEPYGEDGLYRDVNGDGYVSQSDVTAFFHTQHRSTVNDYYVYFDFTNNDRAGHGDVVELFNYVAVG